MDFKFTVKNFFLMVFFFVICPIVGWIIYAHRTNASANQFLNEQNDVVFSNNITIPDSRLDAATPFYQNDASVKLEKETGRPTLNDEEDGYFQGQPKEANEASATETKKESK